MVSRTRVTETHNVYLGKPEKMLRLQASGQENKKQKV
jgi:hypothetical protein